MAMSASSSSGRKRSFAPVRCRPSEICLKTSSAFVTPVGGPTDIDLRRGQCEIQDRIQVERGVGRDRDCEPDGDAGPCSFLLNASPLGLAVISVLSGSPEPFSTLLTLPAETPSATSIVSGRSQILSSVVSGRCYRQAEVRAIEGAERERSLRDHERKPDDPYSHPPTPSTGFGRGLVDARNCRRFG